MSLYDDLDDPKLGGGGTATGWGTSGLKMMQSHVHSKPRRKANLPAGPTLAPVVDLKRAIPNSEGDYRFNQHTGKMERVAVIPSAFAGDPTLPLGVDNEYNPLYPNDYEEYAKIKRDQRRKERQDAEEARLATSGMCKRPEEDNPSDNSDEERDSHKHDRPSSGRGGSVSQGAAIAPPPSLIEDCPPPPSSMAPHEKTVVDTNKFGVVNSVAAKMMARMGYRAGQGLGREGQGMSTALQVEKTSRRGGKIIHEKDSIGGTTDVSTLPTHLLQSSSTVILLRNMVGPGEVDDELEAETAEECTKYGPVVTCMIFELPEANHEEAVRIFIEFEKPESALKAIMDLNGRYFGGRIVKAGFYDEEKFRNLELADAPMNSN